MGSENESGFRLRRSDIITIIAILVYLISGVVSYTVLNKNSSENTQWVSEHKTIQSQVDFNSGWINENRGLPLCVNSHSEWIKRNLGVYDDVLTNKINMAHALETMAKLTEQMELLNKNFAKFYKGSTQWNQNI